MENLILALHILFCVVVVILVLLQHGKGADASAAFGTGGGSTSLFGASGSANFLSRVTAVFITGFFLTSLVLTHLAFRAQQGSGSVFDRESVVAPAATTTKPSAAQKSSGADKPVNTSPVGTIPN